MKITNEDNMVLMARCPDKYFDLAIVDPPYGIGVGKLSYTQASGRKAKQKNGHELVVKKLNYEHKNWDSSIPPVEYFNELKRVSKNQIIWGWNYYGLDWGKGLIKWNKLMSEGVSFKSYEYAFCSFLDWEIEFIFMWAWFCQAKSLLEPTIQQGNKKFNEKRIHPTQKPVKLYAWLLDQYAKPSDKILDTHLGSGSIAIACHDYGYDLTACELDKDYYEAAMKRINNHISQQKLF